MTRIIALTLFCTTSLAAGVVVATPSLATAFRTHAPHVISTRGLWSYSVSGGAPASAAKGATAPAGKVKWLPAHPKTSRRHHSAPAAETPTTTTTQPTTTTTTSTTPTTTPTTTTGGGGSGTGANEATPNGRFTLRGVDARCFGAKVSAGGWPFAPTESVHPIRGSFDEPRSPVHIGVDVEAPKDQAPVFAMQTGKVENVTPDHFEVVPKAGPKGSYLTYWHVNLLSTITNGTAVRRREKLGTIKKGYLHVHISEHAAGCGLVDPSRPDGLLADPYNREWPTIGPLSAMAAGARAFVPLSLTQAPSALTDPDTAESLADLHGTVDLRASVTDMPKVRMQHNPQMALAPAAIRAFLAPVDNGHEHYTMKTIFDGSRLLPTGSPLWHVWAFGTYRQNGCYFSSTGTCGAQIVWHVGGPKGFDTKAVPNGDYKYCVEALTIAGVAAQRCTPVTIKN
jgi:hypothetical protein